MDKAHSDVTVSIVMGSQSDEDLEADLEAYRQKMTEAVESDDKEVRERAR